MHIMFNFEHDGICDICLQLYDPLMRRVCAYTCADLKSSLVMHWNISTG